MRILSILRRWKQDRSGATAVEFAIVANLLILMLVGSFSAGYFFFVKNDLENSISAAERYAMVFDETNDQLRNVINGGLSGYKASDIALTFARGASNGIDYVKINITYRLTISSKFAIPPVTISTSRIFPT